MRRDAWLTRSPMVGVFALVLTACSGGGTDGGVASLSENRAPADGASSEDGDQEAALLEFARCMRDQGIDFPDPTVDADGNVHLQAPGEGEGHGGIRELIQQAAEPCREILEGVAQRFSHEDDPGHADQLLALAQCLRDEGLDVADPDLSEPRGGDRGEGGPFDQLDTDDPAVQEALDTCRDEVFQGGGPAGRSGGEGH